MTGIALMGAGRMARVHAASIAEAGAHVATIYDPVDAAARALAATAGARVCASAAEAMGDSAADAIMIATSSDTHVTLLLEAVRTGKPILCEKPLASSFEEARGFVAEVGEEAARRIFLGFNRRFDRGHASLREAVKAGRIGRLEQLIITSRDPYPPPLEYIPRSGGLFRDMMIHDFDMARSIVGRDIVSVTAHGSSVVDPEIGRLGDVDTASVTMLADDGTIITILNSRRSAFGYDQRIEAFGALGMVLSDNPRQSGFRSFTADAPGTDAPILEFFMERYGPSYTAEIRSFIACASEGREMPVNAVDGLMAIWLAEAATISLKEGRTVRLTRPEDGF